MSGFNHHDPEIRALMHARAIEQGKAYNARTVLGTQARNRLGPAPVAAEQTDLEALRAAFQHFADQTGAVVDRLVEVFQQVGDAFSKLLEQIDQQAEAPRLAHGFASVCPRHGPTKAGVCISCATAAPSFQRLPNLPPPRTLIWNPGRR